MSKKKKKKSQRQRKLGGDILVLNWPTASTVTREVFNTSLFYKSVFEKRLLEVICIYKKSSLLQGVVWGCLYLRIFCGQVQTVCMLPQHLFKGRHSPFGIWNKNIEFEAPGRHGQRWNPKESCETRSASCESPGRANICSGYLPLWYRNNPLQVNYFCCIGTLSLS